MTHPADRLRNEVATTADPDDPMARDIVAVCDEIDRLTNLLWRIYDQCEGGMDPAYIVAIDMEDEMPPRIR